MFWRALGVALIAISLVGAGACSGHTQPPSSATPTASPGGGRPAELPATSQPATQPPLGGIVFAIGGGLWRVDTDGGGLRRLIGAGGAAVLDASAPEFSPDGRLLAYIEGHRYIVIAGDVGADRLTEIRRVEMFDKFPLTPTGADNWNIGPFAVHWSPDGTLLLVTRRRTGGSGYTDVVLMKPDGTERRTVLTGEQLSSWFPEATWSASHATDPQPSPSVVVIGGSDGATGEAYDLQGNRLPAAYPAKTAFTNVAAHQNPAGDGALVTASLGSPEAFGPIEVYDITGASSIVGGGCGATWSPDGAWLSYYDGYGVAVQRIGAAPDDRVYAARNAGVGLDAARQPANACDGVAITWRREPFIDSPG